MANLTLSKEAQSVKDWVDKGNHPNDSDGTEYYDFISQISCSDGFWYGITNGGYIDLKKIIIEASERELTQSELQWVEDIWTQISFEF